MLKRIEGLGLIVRKADKTDRRQCRIVLTEKAEELRDSYTKVSEEMNEIFYREFLPNQEESLEKELKKGFKNLESYEKLER